MKNFKFLLLIGAFSAAVFTMPGCFIDFDDDDDEDIFGCVRGEGDIVRTDLNLNEFHSIALMISGDVFIRQGNDFRVEAEGQRNIIDELDLDVRNGVWEIKFDDCVRSHDDLDIFITVPEIHSITNFASGDIVGQNVFVVQDLSIISTGSGDIDLAVDADDLDTKQTGSGDVRVEGVCENLDLTITGSGDFQGFSLLAQTADVDLTGSGDAEVNVDDSLDVRITGSGDCYYKGDPSIHSTVTGSGRLINSN